LSNELAPRLDPASIEPPIYRGWVEGGHFHVPADRVAGSGAEPYVIVIPPPNVTAVLHMGHGLNNTVQDVLIRWQRMQGRAAVWIPGTDHAGIATQNVVERRLAAAGRTRDELGREAFVEEVWSFVHDTGGTILEQLKAIGASCDWERTRFTLDPELSRAVREVFVRLYGKGLIYRGEYIINWCPRCLTALSNEEAEPEPTDGQLWHLRYPLAPEAWPAAAVAWEKAQVEAEALSGAEDEGMEPEGAAAGSRSGSSRLGLTPLPEGGWALIVSTTRPETMLGDTAIAVNPADPRYAALIGAEVELPLVGRRIPIIADAYVDRAFGTGMVKVTPAHDPNDFEMARRAGNVPFLTVMTPDARMTDDVPAPFRGLDRFEARKAVVQEMEAAGLLEGIERHAHNVPHCYRCDTVVEPRLSDQWFVRMKPLAEPALKASRDGVITFTPERHTAVYENWLENIRDWCISRQLWWGHRIPVWTCSGCGEVIVQVDDPTACPSCSGAELVQDPDVLDTWFSSWLWPFSVFGWPEKTDDLKAFYPGHTLVTAPEILFFWVARMIMSGYEFMGEPPFTRVFLHGTVRDAQGRKMSKSLGNGIDPMEVVERFGADALRYTVLSMCGVGTDIHLDHEDLEAAFAPGRNFANKVWNAGRFTLMAVGEDPIPTLDEVEADLTPVDRWILSRLSRTAGGMTRELERFRLHEASERAYHFFWGDFADWYLELAKGRLRGDLGEASRQAARATIVVAFDGVLRLLHPLIPFVTEALWARLPWPRGATRPEALIVAPWPTEDPGREDAEVEGAMHAFQELIAQVRSLRKEYGVGEGEGVAVQLRGVSERVAALAAGEAGSLSRMARITSLSINAAEGPTGIGAHAVLPSGAELFLPLEGVIDLDRERGRLSAEITRLQGQLAGTEAKLGNASFVERAPEEIVQKERERVVSLRGQVEALAGKLETLGGGS
jgi:valyl-tRNA synthetase